MKILNFGSLNIDHVYRVDHVVRPGETIGSASYRRFCGGKGLNQSIALARAGAEVWHAGKIGGEGHFLLNETEGRGLTGKTEAQAAAAALLERFPDAAVILSPGARGALYADKSGAFQVPGHHVAAVGTTAAGDSFIGYFLAQYVKGSDARHCMAVACRAASLCVTRAGAADSIPAREEIEGYPCLSTILHQVSSSSWIRSADSEEDFPRVGPQ